MGCFVPVVVVSLVGLMANPLTIKACKPLEVQLVESHKGSCQWLLKALGKYPLCFPRFVSLALSASPDLIGSTWEYGG